MISWGGKEQFLDDMQVIDIEPFIVHKRQWERRSKVNSDYRVWLRLSIMLSAIIAAAFLATR